LTVVILELNEKKLKFKAAGNEALEGVYSHPNAA
jgi:hypothetical protein